jgi:hypothetical protein
LHRKQCYIFQPQAAPHTQFYTWTNKNKEKKTNIQEKHKNKTKQKKRKKNKIINNTNTRNCMWYFTYNLNNTPTLSFPRKVLITLTHCFAITNNLIVAKYLDKINCFLLY